MDIATLRKKAGLSQEDLASALGVSQPTISKWERNGMPEVVKRAIQLSWLLEQEYCLSAEECACNISMSYADFVSLLNSGDGPDFFELPDGCIRIRSSDWKAWLSKLYSSGTRRAG